MSTTSGAHAGGEEAVELEDGGEELSTPAVKCRRVQDDSVSLVSGLGESVHYESVAPSRHLSHQYQQEVGRSWGEAVEEVGKSWGEALK